MSIESNDWPTNVTPLHPHIDPLAAKAQCRAFDQATAEVHAARAREMIGAEPTGASSEQLLARLMAMPALNGDQLGIKLRLFSVELAKEAEYGQNPDFRLIPFFSAIQRDCIRILHATCDDAAD